MHGSRGEEFRGRLPPLENLNVSNFHGKNTKNMVYEKIMWIRA